MSIIKLIIFVVGFLVINTSLAESLTIKSGCKSYYKTCVLNKIYSDSVVDWEAVHLSNKDRWKVVFYKRLEKHKAGSNLAMDIIAVDCSSHTYRFARLRSKEELADLHHIELSNPKMLMADGSLPALTHDWKCSN